MDGSFVLCNYDLKYKGVLEIIRNKMKGFFINIFGIFFFSEMVI